MNKFQPHILPVYPPSNFKIFEEWFAENYKGCNTDRELLPIFPTSFHVNNEYGAKANELQEYCDTLDESKKYFIICQYDDGCLVDFKCKYVLEFNMSKKIGVELPLLCQPHPYRFYSDKKYIASFIGSKTHPIRNELEKFKDKDGWYISFEPHSIEDYCRVLHESVFSICPRGYGANSFRISESLQYGAIPVYLSDEFIIPFNADFLPKSLPGWWILVSSILAGNLPYEINKIPGDAIMALQNAGEVAYNEYYTYQGCMNQIIKILEKESASKA